MRSRSVFLAILLLVLTGLYASRPTKTLSFSGYDWTVRPSGSGGPGPNNWDEDNVFVDRNGYLHVRLTQRGGKWYSAEVATTKRFGFGRYEFWVVGRLDQFDPNVVLGLFLYPTADLGPDGTNEIDIEFAKWGNAPAPIGNYTVWPVTRGGKAPHDRFPVSLTGSFTTHRFDWSPDRVVFRSFYGHTYGEGPPIRTWSFQPADPKRSLSQKPMPLRINLWCFKGRPPSDGRVVEIIIRSFRFTPRM